MQILKTRNYEVLYHENQLISKNLNSGEVYDGDYFLSMTDEEAKNADLNLLLNTWDLLGTVSRKGMTKQYKENLNNSERHVKHLLDICMGRK